MDARERRRAIMGVLERAKDPVSGSTLAREVGVSRQVVVQDIALLRADGHDIVATNRGYVLQEAPSSPAVPTRLVKVRHSIGVVSEVKTFVRMLQSVNSVKVFQILWCLTCDHTSCIFHSKLFSVSLVHSKAFIENTITNNT